CEIPAAITPRILERALPLRDQIGRSAPPPNMRVWYRLDNAASPYLVPAGEKGGRALLRIPFADVSSPCRFRFMAASTCNGRPPPAGVIPPRWLGRSRGGGHRG